MAAGRRITPAPSASAAAAMASSSVLTTTRPTPVAGLGGTDAAADQGQTAHRLKVFAGNAFGATAGGNQGQRTTGDCHR